MRDHTGPPFPSPKAEYVRAMPHDTEEQRVARRTAALAWLAQFCARARWYFGAPDIRLACRSEPKFMAEIDKICPSILTQEVVDTFLTAPGAD